MKEIFDTYRGNLCLGHGKNRNNCGIEYKKLKICGIKNNNTVLLKCPKIPTTANKTPAK